MLDSSAQYAIMITSTNNNGEMEMSIFRVSTVKTYGGKSAMDLISGSSIIKTQSNDYIIRIGEVDLDLTDDYKLALSSYGTSLCIMDLSDNEIEEMERLHAQCEANYAADLVSN